MGVLRLRQAIPLRTSGPHVKASILLLFHEKPVPISAVSKIWHNRPVYCVLALPVKDGSYGCQGPLSG